MTNEDILRHRVATALSEILVISRKSILSGFGDGISAYYDVLLRNAFGNYEDLLMDVTLSPAMGNYLTFANNYKTDTVNNIRPDENYAREVMQLFSIGLFAVIIGTTYGNATVSFETPAQNQIASCTHLLAAIHSPANRKQTNMAK